MQKKIISQTLVKILQQYKKTKNSKSKLLKI